MQLSDWPVYRDLVMTSPYDDVIIHKLQFALPPPDWSSIQEGRGSGGADKLSRSGARRKKEKEKKEK